MAELMAGIARKASLRPRFLTKAIFQIRVRNGWGFRKKIGM